MSIKSAQTAPLVRCSVYDSENRVVHVCIEVALPKCGDGFWADEGVAIDQAGQAAVDCGLRGITKIVLGERQRLNRLVSESETYIPNLMYRFRNKAEAQRVEARWVSNVNAARVGVNQHSTFSI